jgi:hypothetical protein
MMYLSLGLEIDMTINILGIAGVGYGGEQAGAIRKHQNIPGRYIARCG